VVRALAPKQRDLVFWTLGAINTASQRNLNMSLFGNLGLGSNQTASSGTSTSGTPAFKPLFGATSTGATSSSLFSGLGGASTSASSGTAQPATSSGLGGGLFGNLGAPKTTAPAASSTQATTLGGATSQPQSQSTGFGLFSKPAGQQAQQSTTTNPLSNTQQTNPRGQSTLFGTTSTQQQQEQSGGPLSQSNAGTGRSSHFDNLLERGRKRNVGDNGLSSFEELPTLQLGLGDIARKVRNLGTGGPSADQGQDRAA
jgi:nuclear pore complex protein Nup93